MLVLILGGAFMLGVCVFIHELGHYLLGLAVGVKAEIFSIGYGRGIWKKEIRGTTWQITAFPIGGYVKFYGDDLTSPVNNVPGGLFSVPPLKRMIPVLGGPLFNLILGFVVFFILHSISGPMAPRVDFWEEQMSESPAYKAGMRSGDRIVSINNEPVGDFHDIQKLVALSAGASLDIVVDRSGESQKFHVQPEVDSAGRAFVGLRAPGKRNLEVSYPFSDMMLYRIRSLMGDTSPPSSLRALPYLKDNDIILKVQDREVSSVYEMQLLLGEFHGQKVDVVVSRQKYPLIAPWFKETVNVTVPTQKEFRLNLTQVMDEKYKRKIPDQALYSNVGEHQRVLSSVKIDGIPAGSFEKMADRLSAPRDVRFSLEDRNYTARGYVQKIGLFGFRPDSRIQTEYLPGHDSFSDVMRYSLIDTAKNVMVYPQFFGSLISGRLSFIDNAMGPVGMFAVAGVVLKSGLQDYLTMFAAISIALFVMNLLPFPVVDGGHIVFFAYEAIFGKPVTPRIMEAIYRGGLAVLLFMGLWIMYRDILFVVGL